MGGFDGVYIKLKSDGSIDDIILAESKSFQGSIGLKPNARGGHAQMSREWIELVMDDMILFGGAQEQSSILMQNFLNSGKEIKKVVTAVDKATGEFNILNFGSHL